MISLMTVKDDSFSFDDRQRPLMTIGIASLASRVIVSIKLQSRNDIINAAMKRKMLSQNYITTMTD